MSTKIHNGLKLIAADFTELHQLIGGLRTDIIAAVAVKRIQHLAVTAVLLHDRRLAGLSHAEDDQQRSPISLVWERLLDADSYCYGGGTSRSHPNAYPDHTFELVIFPHNGGFYAMSFTEERGLERLLKDQPWVEDFGFWDNSDQPDDVRDEDWEARRRVWEQIIDGDCYMAVPGNGGYTVTLSPRQFGIPSWLEIQPEIRSHVLRVEQTAEELVRNEWLQQRAAEAKAAGRELSMSDLLGFGRARKNDTVWNQRINEEIKRLQSVLPAEITAEMLGLRA